MSSLPNLSALTLATEAKEKKQKAKPDNQTPYVKPEYKVIALKEFDEEDEPAPLIQTRPDNLNTTQAERKWLREQYGNDWSKVAPEQKKRMVAQAQKVLAQKFEPLLEARLEEAEAEFNEKFRLANYNAQGLPMLDFAKDLVPFLNQKHPPDWRKDANGNWLDQDGKDARVTQAKDEWRRNRESQLQDKRTSEWAVLKETVLSDKIEELNNPDEKGTRRARFLLRHWFDRIGKDGKKRHWMKSVSGELHRARLKWARSVVLSPGYDYTNPPQPPRELYAEEDVNPFDQFFLPDPVAAVSDQGGQWLWKYMRALTGADVENTQTYDNLGSTADALQYWDEAFRDQQAAYLREQYADFLNSLSGMADLPDAASAALEYTMSSTKFNKYLLWPSAAVGGNPANIPPAGTGAGGVGGANTYTEIGPPKKLHRMYKLLNRCPRLSKTCYFIRSVNKTSGLPHNLGKSTNVNPEVGKGYLNITFMSTSNADPKDYNGGTNLATFYNYYGACCLYIITVPAGTPVLPLLLDTSLSDYPDEEEVVLPPGLVLVFQGTEQRKMGAQIATIHFYEARAPPQVPLPAA